MKQTCTQENSELDLQYLNLQSPLSRRLTCVAAAQYIFSWSSPRHGCPQGCTAASCARVAHASSLSTVGDLRDLLDVGPSPRFLSNSSTVAPAAKASSKLCCQSLRSWSPVLHWMTTPASRFALLEVVKLHDPITNRAEPVGLMHRRDFAWWSPFILLPTFTLRPSPS